MKKASWVPHRLHQRDFRKTTFKQSFFNQSEDCALFIFHLIYLHSDLEKEKTQVCLENQVYTAYIPLKSSGLGDHVPYYVPYGSAMNWSYPYLQAPREFVSENQNFRSGMLWGLLEALRSVDFNFGLTYQIRFECVALCHLI